MKRTVINGKDFYLSHLFPPCQAAAGDTEIHGPSFDHEERIIADLDRYFWRGFSLLQMNQVTGSYVEFGSGATVRSSRLALKYTKESVYPERRLFIFDSFAGLPAPEGPDAHPQWIKGDMAVTEPQFHTLLGRHGAVRNRDYVCIPGFYETTLADHTPADFGIREAAFVHIDCDLYASAAQALDFIVPAMPNGAVLSFDDWTCFNHNPERGEQRAFHELCAKWRGRLDFHPFRSFHFAGQSFVVRRLDGTPASSSQDAIAEQIAEVLRSHDSLIRAHPGAALYGAGGHTRTLLRVWRALGLPPPRAVTDSETAGGGLFEGLPIVPLSSLANSPTLVVLSSQRYEREMHRALEAVGHRHSILSIWDPSLTTA